ncbi:hypothetical protein B0H13DRAFT_763213 [Mycena leptocephala]|nr:hypothetical protein B0H13DRAFT_763213 [Mycena leptocephala]
MSDPEEASAIRHALDGDPSNEAAASKLWAVYVSEAEKYDKSLVESWKSDMEGMLIFAGLFSASLTAFIIESYKTLIPDSGDSTVRLLSQISQQLAAAANGSTVPALVAVPFSPAASSLICNALWFISLGLSLTCALIATLLEQWARDFLHQADMRSSPVIRARVYSYLYYGLKRFNMHTVVDIIPLLLHTSLLFFFGGLVAFLIPINIVIAAIAAVLLGAVVAVYSLLTLLPLWSLDCPYRTPLSTAVWRISQKLMDIWRRRHREPDVVLNTSETETMAEVMAHRAMEVSPARTTRDYRALVWTVKSLADDIELEPFVEALPDLLWAPNGRRYTYENHIQKLIRAPELRLQFRIEALLRSCDGGLLTPEATRRRRITCYKALWAIASVQRPTSSNHLEALDFTRMVDYCRNQVWREEPEVLHYSLSAEAMLRWSTFCSLKTQLATLVNYLVRCRADGCTPDLRSVISGMLVQLGISPLFRTADQLNEHVSHLTAASVPDLIRAIDEFCITTPHEIYSITLHIQFLWNLNPTNITILSMKYRGPLSPPHSRPLGIYWHRH